MHIYDKILRYIYWPVREFVVHMTVSSIYLHVVYITSITLRLYTNLITASYQDFKINLHYSQLNLQMVRTL